MIIEVPEDEKAKSIYVIEELLSKLYVGEDYYEGDVFSVQDITLGAFVKEQ